MKKLCKQLVIVFILGLSLTNCQNEKGNGIIIFQERNHAEPFSKIKVQQGLSVYITMDRKEKIEVEADENIQDLIKTEIKNGTLNIYCKKNIYKSTAKNIHVSVTDLHEINASSGAYVVSENTLITNITSINANSGASINLQISTDSLFTKSGSGATIELKGKTKYLSIKSGSGSTVNAYELKTQDAAAKASSGSRIKITATENLSVYANSGGYITHQGNPKTIQKKEKSGGKISAE